MTEIELDEIIPEAEPIDTSINERKRRFTVSDFASGHCPVCGNEDIRSDMDRARYCYLCQVYAPRRINTLPPTEQELNEGKSYHTRPLHEYTCQYPGCDDTFMSRRNGKNTRKYCKYHSGLKQAEGRARMGRLKRRFEYEANSPQDCAESTL